MSIKVQDPITGQLVDIGSIIVQSALSTKPEETKTVTPNFASGNVVVTPTTGKVLSQVTINKDGNLIAENIKKDITVHGITGTLESGGGISLTNLPFFEYTVGTGANNKVMYLLVSVILHDGHNEYYSGITVKNSSDNAIFNIKTGGDGELRISTDGGSSWTYLPDFALIKLNLKDAIKPYLEYFNETPYPLTIYKYLDKFGMYDYDHTPSAIVKVEPQSGKYYFEEIRNSLYFLIVDLKAVYWD